MINQTEYDRFGPLVEDYRDYFDFTPLFEETILSIIPSILIFVVGLARVVYLYQQPKRLKGRNLQFSKLFTIALYTCLQFVLVALWSQHDILKSKATTAASSLTLLNAVLFLILSYLEHGRNIRPSSVLIFYLFFSSAFDIIRLRTVWSMPLSSTLRAMSTTSLVIKGIILILEASEKACYLPSHFRTSRPEEVSSLLNRGIFYWMNRLLWNGARGFLAPDNIYELDTALTADHLSPSFIQNWLAARRIKPRNSIVKAALKTLKWQILASVFPRIILLVLTVCQPLLLQRFLQYLSTTGPKASGVGRALIALYALLYFGLALSTGFYWHAHYRMLTMLRGCLISALNWQVTRLDLQAVKDPKAALSLMSSDMEQIQNGLQNLHEAWANLIQIAITIYLLSKLVGVASVMPVGIAVIAAGVVSWSGRATGPRQKAWMEAVEVRISLLSSMLPFMKEVKLKGLTQTLETSLMKHRVRELRFAGRFRLTLLVISAAAFTPEFLSPPATFLVFLLQSETTHKVFDATRAFTSLVLVIAMTQPLNNLFQSLPGYIGAFASMRRIEEFLCSPEQEDFRDLYVGVQRSNKHSPVGEDGIELTVLPKLDRIEEQSFAIRITDGCFGWTTGSDVLHDINITIPARKLTFIVGPVASGKSTLCKVFLGETKASKGRVELKLEHGGISFCDQTPTLANKTIKDNIIGFSDVDEQWYHSVICASALTQDIMSLPDGDKTVVGSNGASLSGGQRHKVAFARALYARNKIMVLDDIFSGLDANSAEHIFKHGMGPGSLAQKHDMTVVFATHAIRYLPHAQHVVALGVNGKIVQDGEYEDLKSRKGHIRDLNLSQKKKEEDNNIEEEAVLEVENLKQTADDTNELDAARQLGDFSVYKYYFGSVGWLYTVLVPLSGIPTATFFNLSTFWLKVWTDATETNPNPNNRMYLGIYTLFQALTLVFMLFLAYHVLIRLVRRAGRVLHNRLLTSVMNAPLAIFSKTDAGSIINRFSQDMTLLDGPFAMGIVSLIYSSFIVIGQAVVIAVSSPWTAITYPMVATIFYFIQKFYLKTSRQMRFLDLEAKSPLYTYFLETTSGLATLRAFGWTKPNLGVGQSLLDKSQQPAYLLYMIQRWLWFVLDSVAASLAGIIAALAVTQNSSSGFAGTALSQLMFLNLLMKTIVMMWTEVETSIGAVSRVRSFTTSTPSEHKPLEIPAPPPSWLREGRVQFRNVTAVYDDTLPDQAVLKNISLNISPGEKVGICGRSGSGKSSAVLALFHMLEFQPDRNSIHDGDGTLLIDGIDIRTIPRNELRSRLNVLPQHPFFLHGTVRQNLDFSSLTNTETGTANSHRDNQLIQALHKVGLINLITSVDQLDQPFNPATLSHGQRQLFALASAILRKEIESSPIIVLDEVTSSMDHATDEIMQKIIRDEFKNCTVIAVAHRLNTIVDFDRVVVLSEGRIVEIGRPRELLALGRNSAFGRMWEAGGGGHESDRDIVDEA